MNRHLIALLFLALVSPAYAAPDAPVDPTIKQFVETYFTSWSKADFVGYRACFHSSATVTFKDGTDWRRWELQEFLNDQEYLQSKHKMEEVPLAIHVKSMQGDVAFVEVPWKLRQLPGPEEVTGIDWYVLVRHEKTWQILNLTFWEDAKNAPAGGASASPAPQPEPKP